MRLVQLSDTHLSSNTHPGHTESLERMRSWLSSSPPDLLALTGDLVVTDPDDADDRAYAHATLSGLPADRVVALPGNHDVGEFGPTDWNGPMLNADRASAFADTWGHSGWVLDVPGWRLIGLDLLRPDPQVMIDALEADLAGVERAAVFCHKPLWIGGRADGDEPGWSCEDPWRHRLFEVLERSNVVVASGHLHATKRRTLWEGCEAIWCPSSAFFGHEHDGPGSDLPGALSWEFTPEGFTVERVTLRDLP